MSQPGPHSEIAHEIRGLEKAAHHQPRILLLDDTPGVWSSLREIIGDEFELEIVPGRVESADRVFARETGRPFSVAVLPPPGEHSDGTYELVQRLCDADHSLQVVIWIDNATLCLSEQPAEAPGRVIVLENTCGAIPHIRRIFHLLVEKCDLQRRVIRDRADLRTAEGRAALLDHVPDAIFVQDLDGKLVWWNQGAANLYGWNADEVLGIDIQHLLSDVSPQIEECQAATRTAGSWTGKCIQHHREGQELRVESSWTLVRDTLGNPESILIVNTDITVREQLELKSIRAQRLETIGTFADGIAHDLNNALQPISMAMDLFRTELTNPTSLGVLEDVRRNADRAAELIKQIVSFARNKPGECLPVRLADLVDEVATVVRNTFPQTIEFHTPSVSSELVTLGDITQLCQAVLNLCMNARDAMPDGGALTIDVKQVLVDEHFASLHSDARAGTFFVIKIIDTGEGIPIEIGERVFDPFFTTKTLTQNSGLGLPTALTIVRSHGGFITLNSRKQRGTTVRIFLPIERATSEETGRGEDRPDAAQTFQLEAPGEAPLILLVDDEESVARLIRLTLEKAHYRVIVAGDGAEGLRLYERHREEIRLVVTDMVMPILDGPGMIAAIKTLNSDARILAMTGMTTKASIRAVRRLGIERILSKPCSSKTILAAVREALSP